MTGYGNPSFLEDGKTIVFDRGGAIESMTTDGTGRKVLIAEDGTLVDFPNASLSFDRKSLAAIVDCGGITLRTYSVGALPASCQSGTLVTKVNLNGANAGSSGWSPSGRIAFTQGQEVFVIPSTGGAAVDVTASLGLTNKGAAAAHPVWTPPCATVP